MHGFEGFLAVVFVTQLQEILNLQPTLPVFYTKNDFLPGK